MLILIGSLTGGGAERVAVALARYLADAGYPITVVTMHGTERDFFSLDNRVDRVALGMAAGNPGMRKIGATVRRVKALRSVIGAQSASVVIGMMSTSSILAILACMHSPARVIACERNYPGRKSVPLYWRLLRRLSYPFADAHVAQTRESAEWLARNVGARNIAVIPNPVTWPVPAHPPTVAPDTIVNPGARIILAVGSKVFQKGFDLLVAAFKEIVVDNESWHLVILGLTGGEDGYDAEARSSHYNELRRQASEREIESRVHFPGRVGNMADWYMRADIFVLSSRYEGFPNALLEAMAAGCASIAFDCDTGPRDIIEHQTNGLLAAAEDVDALSASMRSLVASARLRERLGSEAAAVRERFSEGRVFETWKGLIDATAGA